MKIKSGNKRLVHEIKEHKRKDNSKGITLIALIVTIIILIILAGVAITLIVRENGIFKTGQKSVTDYKEKEAREKLELVLLDLQTDKQINIEYNDNDYINNKIIAEGMQISGNFVTVDGWKFEIDRSVPEIRDNSGSSNDEEEIDDDAVLEYSIKSVTKKQLPIALKDNTGKSVDANLKNAEYNEEKTGVVFDGTSTYSQLDSSKLNITFPATITMAVKWENVNNQVVFIDTNSRIGIGTYSGKMLLSAISESQYYTLPSDFTTKEINYITVVYHTSATDNEVFVNGEKLIGTGSLNAWDLSESNTYLGRRRSGSYFKGILYDFKIYSKDFTQEEVTQKYQLDKGFFENNDIESDINKENLILDYSIKNNSNNIEKEVPGILKDLTNKTVDANLQDAEYSEDKKGIVFNGTSTYSQLDSSKLNITFPATITMAVKWENVNDQLIFIDTNSRIGIGTYNGQMLLSAINNSHYYTLPSDFTTKEINYITVIYHTSATDNEIYLNGVKLPQSTSTGAWVRSESGTYLGRRQSGSYFKGILYKFKIYNKLFSEGEVLAEYNKDKECFENN